jgi:hypothetical protein
MLISATDDDMAVVWLGLAWLGFLHHPLMQYAVNFVIFITCGTLHLVADFAMMYSIKDRLCGLVARVLGYRSRGPGFDSRRYQIF